MVIDRFLFSEQILVIFRERKYILSDCQVAANSPSDFLSEKFSKCQVSTVIYHSIIQPNSDLKTTQREIKVKELI